MPDVSGRLWESKYILKNHQTFFCILERFNLKSVVSIVVSVLSSASFSLQNHPPMRKLELLFYEYSLVYKHACKSIFRFSVLIDYTLALQRCSFDPQNGMTLSHCSKKYEYEYKLLMAEVSRETLSYEHQCLGECHAQAHQIYARQVSLYRETIKNN